MTSSDSVVVRQARDIVSVARALPDTPVFAELCGVIVGRRKARKDVCYFDLVDVTGEIQLQALEDELGPASFDEALGARKEDFVEVRGNVEVGPQGQLLVRLVEPPVRLSEELDVAPAEGSAAYRRVGGQILQARLRRSVADYLSQNEFIEIEPRSITVSWAGQGLEPLRVQYPGFGGDAYLYPSVYPQLLEALVATGARKLFAAGHCFTTTYRDEHSSTEAAITSAVARGLTEAERKSLVQGLLEDTFDSIETLAHTTWKDWQYKNSTWPPGRLDTVEVPTVETFANPSITGHPGNELVASPHPRTRRAKGGEVDHLANSELIELSRIILPPRHVAVETSEEIRFGGMRVSLITVFIEQMTYLLESVPLRRLDT